MSLPKLKVSERAYIAGLIDGEGTISVTYDGRNKNNLFVRVLITNTNEELLKWLKERVGGNYHIRNKPMKEGWKKFGQWQIAHTNAIKLLEQIRNYLVIKKDQYLIAITLQAAKKEALEERNENLKKTAKLYPPVRDENGRIIARSDMMNKALKINSGWLDAFQYLKEQMHSSNQKGEIYATT